MENTVFYIISDNGIIERRICKIRYVKYVFLVYLDLHLEIDGEDRLRAKTKQTNKRNDLIFRIVVNVPFVCSNIPATLAYGVQCISLS